MIIYTSWLFKLPGLKKERRDGLTIWPFIFLKIQNWNSDYKAKRIKHENVHWWDQLKTVILGFFISYLIMFLYELLIWKDFEKAYQNIYWERRARRIAGV